MCSELCAVIVFLWREYVKNIYTGWASTSFLCYIFFLLYFPLGLSLSLLFSLLTFILLSSRSFGVIPSITCLRLLERLESLFLVLASPTGGRDPKICPELLPVLPMSTRSGTWEFLRWGFTSGDPESLSALDSPLCVCALPYPVPTPPELVERL